MDVTACSQGDLSAAWLLRCVIAVRAKVDLVRTSHLKFNFKQAVDCGVGPRVVKSWGSSVAIGAANAYRRRL